MITQVRSAIIFNPVASFDVLSIFSGKSSNSFVPAPEWTDCAEQRRQADCLSRHNDPYGMLVDAEIRNAEVERQPRLHVSLGLKKEICGIEVAMI